MSGLSVVAWGADARGQLGTGSKGATQVTPVVATLAPPNISQLGASYHFSALLDEAGDLFMFGGNQQGEQGNGSNREDVKPFHVDLAHVIQAAIGGTHSHALLEDGRVASWGEDFSGQMGNGSKGAHPEGHGQRLPVFSHLDQGAVQISAGGPSVGAILHDGSVALWGGNPSGGLGTGDTQGRLVPTKLLGLPSSPAKKLVVAGAASHSNLALILLEDGTVWGCGASKAGQLGGLTGFHLHPVRLPLDGVTDIAAAASHSLLITADGALHAFGVPGAWIPPTGLKGVTAMAAGLGTTLLVIDGGVWSAGNISGRVDEEPFAPVLGLSGATEVAAGEFHALALAAGAPVLQFRGVAVPGGAALSWSVPSGDEKWVIRWRPVHAPRIAWGSAVKLEPAARAYHLAGLPPATECEVQLFSHAVGPHIIVVTPL